MEKHVVLARYIHLLSVTIAQPAGIDFCHLQTVWTQVVPEILIWFIIVLHPV